ncbi:hypothetical protein Tco_0524653 [Tanacetum coccineum]
MAALTFADSYNMVAYLEKSESNADFAEIVDFLNASSIRYALNSSEPTNLNADKAVHEERGDSVERAATTVVVPGVNTPGSDEERIELKELMSMCTKLSDMVLDLESVKDAQALEIKKLKKRVKKLEKKKKSRTPQLKRRLFKVRIESFAEKSLGDQEYASKQGRIEIDQDEGISWFQEEVLLQQQQQLLLKMKIS